MGAIEALEQVSDLLEIVVYLPYTWLSLYCTLSLTKVEMVGQNKDGFERSVCMRSQEMHKTR